jgi:hypothetical protein
MRRTEFLKYPEHKAVNSSEKALGIHGGGIPARANVLPYRDIQK